MHDESQISNQGEWGDAYTKTNNKGQINYHCKYCGFRTRLIDKIKKHLADCIDYFNTKLIDGYDYVYCQICNFHAQNLGIHLAKIHNVDSRNYKEIYGGNLTSEISHNKYSESATGRDGYVTTCKENGIDLTEYHKNIAIKVSESIMNNPGERERRAEFMAELQIELNKDPEYKKIISDTAKLTSARPDIIAKRSLQLKNWRDNNPEDFKEKCVDKMIASDKKLTWFSKPEKMLFAYLVALPEFDFRFNQVVISKTFDWNSKRKQVDMADKSKNIYVEYDGPFHFMPCGNEARLLETKKRDDLLNKYIEDNKFIIIRISYDQFNDRKKIKNSFFNEECLVELNKILNEKIPGVYKIGNKYE